MGAYKLSCRGQRTTSRVSFFFLPCGSKVLIELSGFGARAFTCWSSCWPIFEIRFQVARLALNSLCSWCRWPWTLVHLASTSQRPGITFVSHHSGHGSLQLTKSWKNGLGVQSRKNISVLWHPKFVQPTPKNQYYLNALKNTKHKRQKCKFHKPALTEKPGRLVTLGKLLLLKLIVKCTKEMLALYPKFT